MHNYKVLLPPQLGTLMHSLLTLLNRLTLLELSICRNLASMAQNCSLGKNAMFPWHNLFVNLKKR